MSAAEFVLHCLAGAAAGYTGGALLADPERVLNGVFGAVQDIAQTLVDLARKVLRR